MAEGYIEDSVQNKIQIAKKIISFSATDSSGYSNVTTREIDVINQKESVGGNLPVFNVSNCNQCTFNIALNK